MDQALLFERTLRSLPLWLLQEYLVELGGQHNPDGTIAGSGWTAKMKQVDDFQIGSIRVGQVHLLVYAEEDVTDTLLAALEKKLLRAGG